MEADALSRPSPEPILAPPPSSLVSLSLPSPPPSISATPPPVLSAVSPPSSSPVLPSPRCFLLCLSAWSPFPLEPPPCFVMCLPDLFALSSLWRFTAVSLIYSIAYLTLGSMPLGDFSPPGLFGLGCPGTWVFGHVPVSNASGVNPCSCFCACYSCSF